MKTQKIRILTVLAAIVFFAVPASADGMLIPDPEFLPEKTRDARPFSIKYHLVNVDIQDQAARTSVDQVFKSEINRRIEATYLFPLPEKSAITNFALQMNGKMVEGRVLDKDEAKRIYEDIVRSMKDPALLEYAGKDLFRARIFPIEPYGETKIELSYHEITGANGDTYHYTYPLSTERFSNAPIQNVSVFVKIKTSSPLKNIYSPSHNISIKRLSDTEAEVGYEVAGSRPSTDFELYYSVSRDDIGVTVLTYKEKSEDGYFLMMASPRFEFREDEIRKKDIIFVVDRTGSMSGEKIEQAREALKFCLRSLNTGDRFNVVTFNESPDPLFKGLVVASKDNVDKALKVASGLSAVGGTNIDGALETSLPMANDLKRPAYVLFLTDGLPTVGQTDISKILENAAAKAPDHIRLFVFGVGYDVNTHLLDKLSSAHKGTSVYVKPGEDLEVKVSDLFRMISSPVLTDIALETGGIGAYDIVPLKLPDIFKGGQVVVTGRFRNSVKAEAGISGTADGKTRSFKVNRDFAKDTDSGFIPALWASRKIGVLLDEIRLHGQSKELVDEVVRLSKKYGIITEYTSFLVEEPAAMQMDVGSLRAMSSENMKKAAKEETGAYAISQSTTNQDMADNIQAAGVSDMFYKGKDGSSREAKIVNTFGDRAFYFDNNVWTDSNFDSVKMKVIKIQNFSEALFTILDSRPDLGEYFAQGDSVLVVVAPGIAVQTAADGKDTLTDKELSHIFPF